jgi:hypothetical protein
MKYFLIICLFSISSIVVMCNGIYLMMSAVSIRKDPNNEFVKFIYGYIFIMLGALGFIITIVRLILGV